MKNTYQQQFCPYCRHLVCAGAPCEALRALHEFDRLEDAYQRRRYRYKAHYSLDRGDGIENAAIYAVVDPAALLGRKEVLTALHDAIKALPHKQVSRIYAHFFLGMSKAEIARAEGVSSYTVRQSIGRALVTLRKKLKDFDETDFSFL
jgi:RNA polymerase sigma-70 factor (ECF subfamily)